MPSLPTGATNAPFALEAVNDAFAEECRIMGVIWTGTTTSGDSAQLKDNATGDVLWQATTTSTKTYKGVMFPEPFVPCFGFVASSLSSGTLFVYISQKI